MHRRLRRCVLALAAAALPACSSYVQVVDRDGTPMAGATVAPQWAFVAEARLIDDEGWAPVNDLWLGLGWWLAPKCVVIRAGNEVFHVPYPLPHPIRLPISRKPPAPQPETNR